MTVTTEELGKVTDEAAWRKIAALHSSDAMLDQRSIGLIKRQNPSLTDEEMARLLRKFQELIALDTVRNEYLLHSKLYGWLMRDPARHNVDKLNEKVYASLFLTPHSDPWLGLFSRGCLHGARQWRHCETWRKIDPISSYRNLLCFEAAA